MNKPIGPLFLFFFLLFISIHASTQEPLEHLVLKKSLKSGKMIIVASNSKFKAKRHDGSVVKGRLTNVYENYLIYNETDTLRYDSIKWIRAKRNLNKTEKYLALGAVFSGLYFTLPMIPGSLMIFIYTGNPAIFMVPPSTAAVSFLGIRTLVGRRYKATRWKLNAYGAEFISDSE